MSKRSSSAARLSTTLPLVSMIGDGLNSIFMRRRTRKVLSELDDRLLRDIGLTRSDVDKLGRRG